MTTVGKFRPRSSSQRRRDELLMDLEYYASHFCNDLKSALNILILQMAAIVTAYISYMAYMYSPTGHLRNHVMFCSIGVMLLMPSAIIFFSGDNFLGRPLRRRYKAVMHGITVGIGALFVIIGTCVEIVGSFTSIHGIIGLVTLILIFLTGIFSLHVSLGRYCTEPLCWKMCHIMMAILTYIFGMTSFCLGFESEWYNNLGAGPVKLKNIMVGLASTITVWTLIPPLISFVEYVFVACKMYR